MILRCAILGSPQKRLTIRGIYAAMEEKYVYFQTAGQTWKVSTPLHIGEYRRLIERSNRSATISPSTDYSSVFPVLPTTRALARTGQ